MKYFILEASIFFDNSEVNKMVSGILNSFGINYFSNNHLDFKYFQIKKDSEIYFRELFNLDLAELFH